MKLSVKWLSDYVALPPVDELARKLTFAGIEVEGIESPGKALAGVVVAQIKASSQHPNADKLSVTTIDAGGPAPLQVVCGAKNYKVGDKVPLATVGTKLPNGVEIKKAQLRGVDSFGMLCSQKELGLAEDASGLYILDPSLPTGKPIAEALGLDDSVFELNVTPNRPDALSHLGVAHEVAAITGGKVVPPPLKLTESAPASSEKIKVRIEDSQRCPRYVARVVEGVKIGPSPVWMQRRLEACGVRAINNVVDVGNYVLLEYGQPMHAFDLDLLAGAEIVVRKAKPGETLTTLDGKKRNLDADDLLICDRDVPQVIAGVMGGATSEVSAKTTRVLLEAANFQPQSIRRSSKRHGLHTESSHRFERGADIGAVIPAIDRAAALIAEVAGGTVLKGRVDAYPHPKEPRRVTLRTSHVEALLGAPVAADECRRILEALGFKAESPQGDATPYVVPTGRVDVEREEDLIEEVARIRGYDAIPVTLPSTPPSVAPEPREAVAERHVRAALAAAGFDEVINYSFVAPKELEAVGQPGHIGLKNPLSADQSMLRTTLLAGLLQNVSRNLRHQVDAVRLYEVGHAYHQREGKFDPKAPPAKETWRVGGVAHGRRNGRTWAQPDAAMDFYDVKGAVEVVAESLRLRDLSFLSTEPKSWMHPAASATVKLAGKTVGLLGQIHPRVAKAFDVPVTTLYFELDLEPLVAAAELVPVAHALPRFPAVLRDIALVVEGIRTAESVREVISQVGGELLEEAALFDVYAGERVAAGQKSLAFALKYRSRERTLTDAEVNQAHERIVNEVRTRLGATLR